MIRLWLALSLLVASANSIAEQLSQYTAVRVQKANELAQNEQLSEAITKLKEIDTSRAYDQAFVARMLGVFYWQNGQTTLAIPQLNNAVESGLLRDENAWITERMLADLYLTDQQFKNSLKHYYALLKNIPENQNGDDIWFRIAQAHYQVEEWKSVIPATDKYLTTKPEEPKQPLSLKLGAQLQLKQWKGAISTLKRLIDIEPQNVEFWRQLVGLHMQLNQHRSALDTLALAKLQGLELSQNDRRLLAQLYAKRGIPERAALEISELEEAASDVDLLVEQARYWQMAKEWQNSIDIWQKAAAIDAKYHWETAQLLLQQGQYQQALTTLNKVKGRKEQVALAKTRAHYKLGDLEKAVVQAKAANDIKPSKQAESWVKYLNQLRQQS
ncbi:tetratricopeptide repeat protein [Vibrio maerlii]|uniref:tetratricopeptide repeat protein n=1 Tax=Vibrio maerlii TaxID=2231648 RepID=UPI000E3BF0E9|nr:tetratricopeptide repeat protein [Vibrio maerlii]